MAALPVSPDVAPMTVRVCRFSVGCLEAFLRTRKYSKRLPTNWRATSLKAKVGPWKSSRIWRLSEGMRVFRGVISGWRKVEYDFSMRVLRSSEGISEGEM